MIEQLKANFREEFKIKRKEVSFERRASSAGELLEALSYLSRPHRFVLSFESFQDEISTLKVNRYLEEENKLVLPYVDEKFSLKLYKVNDRALELKPSPLGFLQPDPLLCELVDLKALTLILVPGLGFDGSCNRIGYGKGCYDGLLKNLKDCISLGIGFREQYSRKKLPKNSSDVPLTALLLF